MTISQTIHARVILVGNAWVGKTSLLNRLLLDRFDPVYRETIAAEWHIWRQSGPDSSVELQIWDTAGQETFRALGPLYYRNSAAALFVYDVAVRESFNALPEWIAIYRSIAPDGHVFVAGNKNDLPRPHAVTTKDAQAWAAAEKHTLYETSALTGENVQAIFAAIGERIAYGTPVAMVSQGAAALEATGERRSCC
jgi:small GTP-binding protein